MSYTVIYSKHIVKPKELIEIFNSDDNQIFIPPRFEELELNELKEIASQQDETGASIQLFTSGSTGEPKRIKHFKNSITLNGKLSVDAFLLNNTSNAAIIASPWHVAGLTWALGVYYARGTFDIYIPRVDDLDHIAKQLKNKKYSHVFTVPTALNVLLNHDWFAEELIIGGASMIPEKYEAMKTHCSHFTQAYGQTEAGGLISSYRKKAIEFEENDWATVGNILEECELEIRNNDEIWFKSPTALEKDWYFTGDSGEWTSTGALRITGRKKDGGNCNSLSGISMVLHK